MRGYENGDYENLDHRSALFYSEARYSGMRARHPGYEYDDYEDFCRRSPDSLPDQLWIPVSETFIVSKKTTVKGANTVKRKKDDPKLKPVKKIVKKDRPISRLTKTKDKKPETENTEKEDVKTSKKHSSRLTKDTKPSNLQRKTKNKEEEKVKKSMKSVKKEKPLSRPTKQM